jgi:hypothetical protein
MKKHMAKDLSQKNRGAPLAPSEAEENHSNPGNLSPDPKEESRHPEYKNVETSVGSRKDYGDEFETQKEDEISREEAKTEEENDTSKERK